MLVYTNCTHWSYSALGRQDSKKGPIEYIGMLYVLQREQCVYGAGADRSSDPGLAVISRGGSESGVPREK